MTDLYFPRMRTIDAALTQLQRDDPGSSLTRHALRRMVLLRQVPYVKVGNRYLINYDGLLATLGGKGQNEQFAQDNDVIRRVGE